MQFALFPNISRLRYWFRFVIILGFANITLNNIHTDIITLRQSVIYVTKLKCRRKGDAKHVSASQAVIDDITLTARVPNSKCQTGYCNKVSPLPTRSALGGGGCKLSSHPSVILLHGCIMTTNLWSMEGSCMNWIPSVVGGAVLLLVII